MNPSIKRLLGALLLIGTLGVSSVMAVRANGLEPAAHVPAPASVIGVDLHG